MKNEGTRWFNHRFHWFEPVKVGFLLAVGSALALFWFANQQGVEELIGLTGSGFLGVHIFLTPHYYRAEMDKVEREKHLDKHSFVLLMAVFLMALWAIAQFII